MNRKFTPAKYLNSEQLMKLKKVRADIETAKTKEQLQYYESILDKLLEIAITNFKKEQKNKKQERVLQHT
ncbi:hypothetical protein [Fictibacillus phosphorivorans]|uniref:hypothetical protein n=1 Tax=Fictibacillus phosphorivorans TaxID=1221500 RepID=UPI0020412EF1|nr:hypothetical protein [Fictibacillus phosphorivorans]MCM3717761.1 hypothetical protein [Fictibacillus phosphorivorans]MCM3775662.1 hypothetical protein [Fictibacillus phosphorivorans]